MRTNPKRGLLAAAAAVALAGAGLAASVGGQAQAQSGSRLCGMFWHATDTGEYVVNLYEVGKHNQGVTGTCRQAERTGGGPGDHNAFEKEIRGKTWEKKPIHMVVCEDFTQAKGWLHGTKLTFVGDDWPTHDRKDICNNMNRSDTRFDMERYSLYEDGINETYLFARN